MRQAQPVDHEGPRSDQRRQLRKSWPSPAAYRALNQLEDYLDRIAAIIEEGSKFAGGCIGTPGEI